MLQSIYAASVRSIANFKRNLQIVHKVVGLVALHCIATIVLQAVKHIFVIYVLKTLEIFRLTTKHDLEFFLNVSLINTVLVDLLNYKATILIYRLVANSESKDEIRLNIFVYIKLRVKAVESVFVKKSLDGR